MTNVDRPTTSVEARNALVLIAVSALQELHSGKPVPLSALAAQLRTSHPWLPAGICEPAVKAAYSKDLVVTDTINGITVVDLVEPAGRRGVFGGGAATRSAVLGRARYAADALDSASLDGPVKRDRVIQAISEARTVNAKRAAELLARAVNYGWVFELPDGFMSVRGLFHGTIDSGSNGERTRGVRCYQQDVSGSATIESQIMGTDVEDGWAISLTQVGLLQMRDAMDDGEYMLPALQRMFDGTGMDPKNFLKDQGVHFDFWSRMRAAESEKSEGDGAGSFAPDAGCDTKKVPIVETGTTSDVRNRLVYKRESRYEDYTVYCLQAVDGQIEITTDPTQESGRLGHTQSIAEAFEQFAELVAIDPEDEITSAIPLDWIPGQLRIRERSEWGRLWT